ncbi:hypothetical protein [Bradyrhizobium sp. CSA207]|uniref:hypothetical protein n=1 Tax=Bradyrhizobium sp. CSA207 TaxID=2698826 RepID=UPI0023AF1B19|nr:hypothetical protein [Bradyrhizobium sp. CSA207]
MDAGSTQGTARIMVRIMICGHRWTSHKAKAPLAGWSKLALLSTQDIDFRFGVKSGVLTVTSGLLLSSDKLGPSNASH